MMTGQIARGANYFPRLRDQARLWRRLRSGGHVILLSPRRVGKSSLLHYIADHPELGYVFLYTMDQSSQSEHEFYTNIIDTLQQSEFISRVKKALDVSQEAFNKVLGILEKIKIFGSEVTLKNNPKTLDADTLNNILSTLCIDDKKLILVMDEVPDVLDNIYQKDGLEAAKHFLAGIRGLCQDVVLNEKVQFIVTGSIGLDTLAHKLEISDLINVFDKTTIEPLSADEGIQFIDFHINKSQSHNNYSNAVKQAILDKVEWLMPYYVEQLWLRLDDYCYDHDIVQPQVAHVDFAFTQLFESHYRTTFNHWAERLNKMGQIEMKFARAVLDELSHKNSLTFSELFNISQASAFINVDSNYVINSLEHDGYIFEFEPKVFKFTSPILKEWWDRYANRTL